MERNITAGEYNITEIATGILPNFNNPWEATKYVGGLALDGLGTGGAGTLSKFAVSKISLYFSEKALVSITGNAGSSIVNHLDDGFEVAANFEVIVETALKGGWGGLIASNTLKQGLNKAVNLNANAAKGNFGIYEIIKDGQLYKYGKADLGRITHVSGNPTRLHQQLRKLEELFPNSTIRGKVIDDLGQITAKSAKSVENAYLNFFYKTNGFIPEGNFKSFIPR